MAKEKATRPEAGATGVTKAVVSSAPVAGYSTTDGNEALKYINAGGHHVTTVKQFPNNPFKPGKRFGFLESKEALDALVAHQDAEEGV